MAIKIQTQQTGIPIEIGELTFYFDTTDENIFSFEKKQEKITKELEELNPKDDADLEDVKEVLRRGFDLFLGKGAFDKIYDQTPSVLACLSYLEQVGNGIAAELNKMSGVSAQVKAKKYAKSKKKK